MSENLIKIYPFNNLFCRKCKISFCIECKNPIDFRYLTMYEPHCFKSEFIKDNKKLKSIQ